VIRTSISPNIVQGGYRVNVIPSETKATLDVRMVPGEDTAAFLREVQRVIGDPAVTASYTARDVRPETPTATLNTEAFRVLEAAAQRHYNVPVLPTMLTGATDMAYVRAKGTQCYGIGPAFDVEDGPKGFGAHSDQERILESELHRFVRFQWDVVTELARSRRQP
jgi:acetylornithine deacetylase/succinyl-diaminopimelate desuccinylase-like protein